MRTERHFVSVCVDEEVVNNLIHEASTLDFSRVTNDKFAIQRAQRKLTSPFDLALADASGRCLQFAQSAMALSWVHDFTGSEVGRVSCTYLAYGEGSYMGCHTDRIGCDANLLLLLAGGATVFELHPDYRATGMDELLEMSRVGRGFIPQALRSTCRRLVQASSSGVVGSHISGNRVPNRCCC